MVHFEKISAKIAINNIKISEKIRTMLLRNPPPPKKRLSELTVHSIHSIFSRITKPPRTPPAEPSKSLEAENDEIHEIVRFREQNHR